MSGEEIRDKIKNNNELIEKLYSPLFVLNKQVQEILIENNRLRDICPHSYDELGYCIYCDKNIND